MFSDFTIAYSYWYILLAILTGLSYATILYVWNASNKLSLFWATVLFILRFLTVFILAFLLLSPFIKTKEKFIEKPIVVLGYDNSQSIILGRDSSYYRNTFSKQWQDLPALIGDNYRTEAYLFGSEIKKSIEPNNADATSDYSKFIIEVKNEFIGMNLGAIILAGDGIYNQGVEPVFAASGISVPIYTIALGDTTAQRDLKIADIRYNSLVYKDDIFPIEVSVSAKLLKGMQAKLIVSAFGEPQQKKFIDIINDDFTASYSFQLKAEKTGKHHVKIDLQLDNDELNKANNHSSIFIDVFDNAQKILILAYSPHPDLSAINQSLKSFPQYETEIAYIKKIDEINVKDYDLIILHQIPTIHMRTDELLNEIADFEIPTLFILGGESNLPVFNQYFKGMNILTSIGKFEESRPDINSLFTRFSYDIDYASQLEKLPPLISPLGNYIVSKNADIFVFQRINSISTDFPLIVFYDASGVKSATIAGEGIWMWRIHNYLNDANFEAFDSFLNKSIQYLSAKKDKRFFRVFTKDNYTQLEKVMINAELYNDSYETISDAEISLKLTNEDGQQFNFLFSPKDRVYSLDLKQLNVGVYKYVAQAQFGNENYEAHGEFSVSGQSLESRKLEADHAMLLRLSKIGGGKMLYPNQLSELPSLFAENEALKKRTYFEEKLSAFKAIPALLVLLLFLISLEWFLRKYFGSY